MSDVNWIVVLSRWLHLAAAMVALGGAAYVRLALLPSLPEALDEESAGKLREAVRRRWATVTHSCVAVLLITGGVNFVVLALGSNVEPMPYHAIFAFKFLTALLIFFLAIALVGRSPAMAAIRAKGKKWISVVLVLGALIVLLSGILNQVRTTSAGQDAPVRALPAGE